jgi:hypothetical protein
MSGLTFLGVLFGIYGTWMYFERGDLFGLAFVAAGCVLIGGGFFEDGEE